MVHVMLNPPKKSAKKKAAKKGKPAEKGKPAAKAKRKRGPRVCMPKSVFRHAKSLRSMKRKFLRKQPRKKIICLPKAVIRSASSLKKLKHRYLGVKYGFARKAKGQESAVPTPTIHQVKIKGAGSGLPSAGAPMGPYGMYSSPTGRVRYGMPSKSSAKKAAKKAAKAKKISYQKYLEMLPLERKMAGITRSMVANPMRARNYPLPVYSLNDVAELDSFRDGITAGYRPSAMMSALPIVGGLVANSLLSALAKKLVTSKFTVGEKWQNPLGLAVSLGTAGALAAITRLVAPKYAGKVFLGAVTQVAWDGYQNYVAPKIKKTLGLEGMKGWDAGSDTFGLWCDECDKDEDIGDIYPRPAILQATIPATVDQIVGTVVPPAAISMQSPPNVSAPTPDLVAKVNGKTVPVERVGSPRRRSARPPVEAGVGEMGDFLTPNQVASATSLGDTGDMSSYL